MVIVGRVPREHGPQVRLVDDEQVVQALLPEGADDALRDGVGIRRPGRRPDDSEAFRGEDRIEAGRELAVAIPDEEAEGVTIRFLQLPAELARLLGDPGGIRGRGAAREVQPPRAELDEDEDIQPLQEERVHGEEVAGEQLVAVLREEGAPRCAPAPGSGRQGMPPEDPLTGSGRQGMPPEDPLRARHQTTFLSVQSELAFHQGKRRTKQEGYSLTDPYGERAAGHAAGGSA